MTTTTTDILGEHWRVYAEARRAHEQAQAAELLAKRARYDAEQRLCDLMIEHGYRQAEIDGKNFDVRRKVNISVTKDNEDLVRGWLAMKLGQTAVQDFLEVKVRRSAVDTLVKDELKDGAKIEDYPAFLKLYVRPGLYVRGWDGDD